MMKRPQDQPHLQADALNARTGEDPMRAYSYWDISRNERWWLPDGYEDIRFEGVGERAGL